MIQPFLCSGKSVSTDLSVFMNSSESSYDVYIGLALLERVNINHEDIQHKMLVGHLRNAGVKLGVLKEKFGHDARTIKKWATALKSGDIDELVLAFSGRSSRKKTSPELIRYVQQLYRSRSSLGRNYREIIISKVEEVFSITISPSLASEIFRTAKQDYSYPENHSCEEEEISGTSGQVTENSGSQTDSPVQMSPLFPFLTEKLSCMSVCNILLHHAGLVFFAMWLRLYNPVQRQFICQVLQGAVNVEQSKSLCHKSLSYFCENPLPVLQHQRNALDLEASLESTMELYQKNNSLLSDGPGKGDMFYFDPHTKEYTGHLKVLKGWCGRRHGISKVINLDCFHTRSGRPCFIQHYSPFYDMRERFFMSIKLFDQLFDEDERQGRTFVIDRAIYGLDTLRHFNRDYVITWEKGFNGQGWDNRKDCIIFTRHKKRNNSSDLQSYTFKCQETVWKRDGNFRRIIVNAQKNDGKEITVSVLCSNPDMDVQDIVWAIFNRWLQENDFKYLDVYYGINQLDSRAYTSFAVEADRFRDRAVDSQRYKELKNNLKNTEDRFARHLLSLRKKSRASDDMKIEIRKLEFKISGQREKLEGAEIRGKKRVCKNTETRLRQLCGDKRKLEKKLKKTEVMITEMQNKLPSFENEIDEIKEELNQAVRKESRLKSLIEGCYQLLDLRRKAYMDALRVNAANQFRNLHEQFRAICDNYRDDHVRLRMLTRCSGFLNYSDNTVKIKLWLPGNIQPYIIRHMQSFIIEFENIVNNANFNEKISVELISGIIQT